jgi:hypothetical protein
MAVPPPRLQMTIQSKLGLPALSTAKRPPQEGRDYPAKSRRPNSRARFWENEGERSDGALSALCVPRVPPVDEIVQELRRYRYDRPFKGAWRVPIAALVAPCDVDRKTIYTAMMGQAVSHAIRAKLSWTIFAIQEGRLRFLRRGQRWEFEFRNPHKLLPPPQPSLIRDGEFNEWSRCWACESLRWSLVSMNGSPWYVCMNCLPKSQWPTIGASRLTSRSHHQRGWRG